MELREFVDKELSFAVVTTRTPVDEKVRKMIILVLISLA